MSNVPIRQSVVKAKIVDIKRTVSERIALVRIIILIFGQYIVPFKLIMSGETFSHSHREAIVE